MLRGMSTKYSQVVLQEVALGVSRVDAPPVVDEDVENTEEGHQETGTPFRLESNGDHDTSAETDNGNEDPGERPVTLEDESDEQEDKEDTTSKLEAASQWRHR